VGWLSCRRRVTESVAKSEPERLHRHKHSLPATCWDLVATGKGFGQLREMAHLCLVSQPIASIDPDVSVGIVSMASQLGSGASRLTLRARCLSGPVLEMLDFAAIAEITVAVLTHILREAIKSINVSFV
jgi:hypothetical protein